MKTKVKKALTLMSSVDGEYKAFTSSGKSASGSDKIVASVKERNFLLNDPGGVASAGTAANFVVSIHELA